jgi:hypothetical protein
VRSVNPFLSILLAVGILSLVSSGCSALGYGLGYSLDMKKAVLQPVANTSELKKGDHIRLVLVDDTAIDAIVKTIGDRNLSIGYRESLATPKGSYSWNTRTLDLKEIKQIEKKIPRTGGRTFFTTLGVVGDSVIVFIIWSFRNIDGINTL